MPRLLCVYPGSGSERAVFFGRHRAELREREVELVLADDWPVESDRKSFDRILELPPPEEVRVAARVLERFAAAHAVDGVLCQSEAALAPGAWIAAELGLPGPGLAGALACIDKHRSRTRLAAADVPVPAFALASDAGAVREFARAHGFPIVLKGVASALGRLVTRVDGDDEIDGAVARMLALLPRSRDIRRLLEFAALAEQELDCDPLTAFLVEAYAPGDPLETDGLVVAGEAHVFGVIEQRLTPPPRFYVESYLLPADRPEGERARLAQVSRAALAASGLESTGFSIELRADGADVRVIEVNARLGEDDGFGDLFHCALGLAPLRAAIDVALGVHPELPDGPRGAWALAFQNVFDAGRVTRIPEAADFERLERDGLRAGIDAYVGKEWFAAPHPEAFPHIAWVLASDPASSRRALEQARAAVASLRIDLEPPGESRRSDHG